MPEPTIHEHSGVRELRFTSPILSTEHLGHLAHTLDREAASSTTALVISSQHPKIFLAGAHLAEIARLDAHSSLGYARFGRRVIQRISTFPTPVVAAVDGPCTGGGFDLVLACDGVVAGPSARFSHPGVRRGLVTGWGGTESLPRGIGRSAARSTLLEGGDLGPSSSARLGIIAAGSREALASACSEARRLAAIHPSRLALWRALKSGRFIDRFRVFMVHNL